MRLHRLTAPGRRSPTRRRLRLCSRRLESFPAPLGISVVGRCPFGRAALSGAGLASCGWSGVTMWRAQWPAIGALRPAPWVRIGWPIASGTIAARAGVTILPAVLALADSARPSSARPDCLRALPAALSTDGMYACRYAQSSPQNTTSCGTGRPRTTTSRLRAQLRSGSAVRQLDRRRSDGGQPVDRNGRPRADRMSSAGSPRLHCWRPMLRTCVLLYYPHQARRARASSECRRGVQARSAARDGRARGVRGRGGARGGPILPYYAWAEY